MASIVSVNNLTKVYKSGFKALNNVNLDIEEGELIALLGPNGAGKTTLISTICGITVPTSGSIKVNGYDTISEYQQTRKLIGLVPQEITLEPFEKVINSIRFSRGVFGKPRNDAYLEKLLVQLTLLDKRDERIFSLSGGMRRRVLIAKALSHEPRILFLDEPTAGVDVELRRDMWETVANLKREGVTIILTTHYIEEAEAIADRIAVINKGEILLVQNKDELMAQMGEKQLYIELSDSIIQLPSSLDKYSIELEQDGLSMTYTYDCGGEGTGIRRLLNDLYSAGFQIADLQTRQSTLEEVFVNLVKEEQ